MSHIPAFQNAMQSSNLATPRPRDLGRSVRDFYIERDALATPRRFGVVSTPMVRKVNFAPDLVAGTEEDEHKEHLEELTGQTWQVHSVGPLFSFDRNNLTLLAQRLQDSLPPCAHNDVDQVHVETVMGIRGSREDAQAIRITVKRMTNGREISLLVIYLLSVDAADLDLESPHVNLPVSLSAGDATFSEIIFESLERLFDTIIRPVDFTADDLQWMISLWSSFKFHQAAMADPDMSEVSTADAEKIEKKNKKFDVVKFRFQIPSVEDIGIKTIDIQLEGHKVRGIWNSIRSENYADFTVEEKEAFMESLQMFIKSRTDLDIKPLVMTNFSLPILSAANVGRVRINGVKNLKSILRFLTSKCQGDMLSAKPRMALLEDPGTWEALAQL